eukprot:g3656.t1
MIAEAQCPEANLSDKDKEELWKMLREAKQVAVEVGEILDQKKNDDMILLDMPPTPANLDKYKDQFFNPILDTTAQSNNPKVQCALCLKFIPQAEFVEHVQHQCPQRDALQLPCRWCQKLHEMNELYEHEKDCPKRNDPPTHQCDNAGCNADNLGVCLGDDCPECSASGGSAEKQCGEMIAKSSAAQEEHKAWCQAQLCTDCEEIVPKFRIERHKQSLCPKRRVKCPGSAEDGPELWANLSRIEDAFESWSAERYVCVARWLPNVLGSLPIKAARRVTCKEVGTFFRTPGEGCEEQMPKRDLLQHWMRDCESCLVSCPLCSQESEEGSRIRGSDYLIHFLSCTKFKDALLQHCFVDCKRFHLPCGWCAENVMWQETADHLCGKCQEFMAPCPMKCREDGKDIEVDADDMEKVKWVRWKDLPLHLFGPEGPSQIVGKCPKYRVRCPYEAQAPEEPPKCTFSTCKEMHDSSIVDGRMPRFRLPHHLEHECAGNE